MYNYKYFMLYTWLVMALLSLCEGTDQKPCKRRDISEATSFVCECSAEYCDTIPRNEGLHGGEYAMYSSNKDKHRFHRTVLSFDSEAKHNLMLTLNASAEYQMIQGFGGSFTDSATMNIDSISAGARQNLLKSYFSPEGIEYTLGRVPIHSCDFSTHVYSYDDTPGDFELDHFSLAPEDMHYKIPVIKEAQAMSAREIKLFASPWSAPAWMKDSGQMAGGGALIGQPGGPYYKTWAKYFIRFLKEYEKQGVPMWGLTIQNEPSAGNLPAFLYPWQSMSMPPEIARDFVKMDLGPALHSNDYGCVKLMSHDDNIPSVLADSQVTYSDREAAEYLSGIAIHWYLTSGPNSYKVLDETHQAFPDKFLLATEACNGYKPGQPPVKLGDWERGEKYSLNILQDLNHWVTGWVDWNLALDMTGGPNWAANEVDSPIIVDAERDFFYKQPMYYHMGHFSKFIPPGSLRVDLASPDSTSLYSIAFKQPDDTKVVVLLNTKETEAEVTIHDKDQGYINTKVPPRSIHTYIW